MEDPLAGLHVEQHGTGPALVLAHGFAGSARNWRPQVRALRESHRVVVYDSRGHARSDAPEDPKVYSEAALVRDLGAIVGACGDAHPVVGGLSMGAAVALAWALAEPATPRGLILASLPAGPGSGRGVSAHSEAFAAALDLEGVDAAGARFAWGPGSGLDELGAALVRQGFLEHPPHGLAHILREFLGRRATPAELAPRLQALNVPTLVLAGELDKASLPASRELAGLLPRARLEVIPAAGHVVNLAQPAAVNSVIHAFLVALDGEED
ncbi:MAG: alpha/beta fold hydrolase [Deltaproteobacteria bacterium]|nr:alpha/beta fold hydrolase [Deltaproteobacteria bacterium]MBW2394321.1 alpha/beta fold hydrolase [Deltaproteobacteria bacterium]